ncbi:ribosomal protein L10-domain-containing protein [Suillus subalutaceus]|uniref:ribosomal protein L10-domain-containing protein n=1 Tax=Suillus subalutaceus TaxID=48586 RepID=UPI001B868D39|nr:ribosomal protein L10-domain-containing protein [Suillus subalutaceus]KAG1851579.1 ribosomal protein L10-domain-containing protein [Suillus subalutaceus]
MGATRAQKEIYFIKLKELISKYPSIFIVNVDNVSSNQMHQIRVALRGKGVVLMGKNTMVRRALRTILSENPQFERLLPHVRGNIGFVFTDKDLKEVREIIVANKIAAPARAGAYAPKDVFALGIPTKIARGTIEISSEVQVVTAGSRIFDSGNAFAPEVLDIDEKVLIDRFMSGIQTIAAISLALNYPTVVSVTHSLVNSYKNLIALCLSTDYMFEGAQKAKEYLENPDAFAAVAAPAAAEAASAAVEAEVEEKAEEKEESDDDMGFGLFD